jgi:hypothetical protein
MSVRVINLGLPKSGTTTLARALSEAGMSVADHKIRRKQTDDPHLAGTFVARQIYRGYFHAGDPLEFLGLFEALTEISVLTPKMSLWPQMDFGVIDRMRRLHPDLRFVATMRDAREMSDSMLRWSNLGTERLPDSDVPGLPAGFGETSLERVQWIEAHHAHLRAIFAGDARFLELPVAAADARARLAAHLGRDIPWWGRENVNTGLPARGAA